ISRGRPGAGRTAAGGVPTTSPPAESGRLRDDRLNEVSGLVAGRSTRPALWLTEDSGNGPWLYAVTTSGDVRAAIEVSDASNRDWEDMALGMGRLWIGDIGDNARARPEIQVYWFPEPSSLSADDARARLLTLRYPDGAHNAEAMVVDEKRERLFVFEKQRSGPISSVYAADIGGLDAGATLELSLVARVDVINITAADTSRDGVVLKNNTSAFMFPWSGGRVARTLRRVAPCVVALPAGETVAFSRSGHRIYGIPEGRDAVVSYAARRSNR
ncbi:MAG: hypothetical protein ACXWX9_04265, partial [Actinomycetota bacterium]